jgi:hypothetical protein
MPDPDAAEAFVDFPASPTSLWAPAISVPAIDRVEQSFSEHLPEPRAKGADISGPSSWR